MQSLDFIDLPRDCRGAGAALVLSWDVDRDGWLHGRMAIKPRTETGRANARPTRSGPLTASDSRRRAIADTGHDPDGTSKLIADLPAEAATTPYVLLGDWLALGCARLARPCRRR